MIELVVGEQRQPCLLEPVSAFVETSPPHSSGLELVVGASETHHYQETSESAFVAAEKHCCCLVFVFVFVFVAVDFGRLHLQTFEFVVGATPDAHCLVSDFVFALDGYYTNHFGLVIFAPDFVIASALEGSFCCLFELGFVLETDLHRQSQENSSALASVLEGIYLCFA